jgi:integrase
VLVIERSVSRGRLKAYGKTARSRRRVPLSRRALEALDALPRRLDTRLVFSSPRGKHLDLENWRRRDWHPALDAAGIPSRRIYDLRHTFATHALAAGLSIFEVARFMGTSVRVIDSTYGHLAHGSEQLARQRLDVWALNGRGGETGTQ